MKNIPSQLAYFLLDKKVRRNFKLLLKLFLILAFIIMTYSILFYFLMLFEGKNYSWITGIYWTLNVISTQGFGDITFKADLSLIFSIIVLLTGIVYLLVMLLFTFIKFFYAPWLATRSKTRTPRKLPEDMENHIILTTLDVVTEGLIKKLTRSNYEHFNLAI